jgi:hypothetical protein
VQPLDLALKDAHLVPEDQELEPEASGRPVAIDEGVEEETEDGVEEGQNHDRPSWQVGSSRRRDPAGTGSGFLTAHGYRGSALTFARATCTLAHHPRRFRPAAHSTQGPGRRGSCASRAS